MGQIDCDGVDQYGCTKSLLPPYAMQTTRDQRAHDGRKHVKCTREMSRHVTVENGNSEK